MISCALAGQAVELRVLVEALTGGDVEALRVSDRGTASPNLPRNTEARNCWKPTPAWNARVELWRLARAIDEALRDCGA